MKQALFTTLFAVIICLLGACGNKGNADTAQNRPEAREVCTKDSIEAADSQEAQHAPEPTEEICRERVKRFTKQQGIVVASFPDDSRYSVYYCKTDEYGRKFLYHYDAVSDSSEKMQLPINATGGEYTHLWVTKNRYIFVAAEYRYTDFIRIDTRTKQIMHITECLLAKRSAGGFTLVQDSCINESEAQCMADREYVYRDYYYNEEGVCTGRGSTYTTSPY